MISSIYPGSCVANWVLASFAFGCSATQRFVDLPSNDTYTLAIPSNCTVSVEGLDGSGKCVGQEKFDYDPFPLHQTALGVPFGSMTLFNTTKGGLKGKRVKKVKISAKIKESPGFTYIGPLGVGIDAVSYTVYNKTSC